MSQSFIERISQPLLAIARPSGVGLACLEFLNELASPNRDESQGNYGDGICDERERRSEHRASVRE